MFLSSGQANFFQGQLFGSAVGANPVPALPGLGNQGVAPRGLGLLKGSGYLGLGFKKAAGGLIL